MSQAEDRGGAALAYALSVYGKRKPVYQCAKCGAWVHVAQPIVMRLEGRLYVGRPCPNCGTFVGVSLPTETRKAEFIPESQKRAFEQESKMKLGEANRIQVGDELGYAVIKMNSGMQDYVNMLAEQSTAINGGVYTVVRGNVKEDMIERVESGAGGWV